MKIPSTVKYNIPDTTQHRVSFLLNLRQSSHHSRQSFIKIQDGIFRFILPISEPKTWIEEEQGIFIIIIVFILKKTVDPNTMQSL